MDGGKMELNDIIDDFNRLKYSKLKKLVEENGMSKADFCQAIKHPFLVGKEFYDGHFAPGDDDILSDSTVKFSVKELRSDAGEKDTVKSTAAKIRSDAMSRAMYILKKKSVNVSNDFISIGRRRTNDIVMLDFAFSKEHAAITLHDGMYFIVDRGSTNGTEVNGVRIEANTEVPVDIGTQINFGQRFCFVLTDPMNVYDKIMIT